MLGHDVAAKGAITVLSCPYFLDTRALRNLSLASFYTVIAPLAAVQEDASEAVVGLDLYASAWPTQRCRL